jgi:hypothetical protein
MYSAWSAALINGIALAVALAIGIVVQLANSSTPDPLPVAFIVGSFVVTALVAGILVMLTVRGGLLLARCGQLPLRSALVIAAVNVVVLGFLGTAPVETYAIELNMPAPQGSHVEVPLLFWLLILAGILLPIFVAYVVGRIAKGRASVA